MNGKFRLVAAREATGMGSEVGKKDTLEAWLEQLATAAKKADGDEDTDGDEAGGKGKACAADTAPETVGNNGVCQGGLGFSNVDKEPLKSKPSAPENWSEIPDGG
jgi:hypothetical protein